MWRSGLSLALGWPEEVARALGRERPGSQHPRLGWGTGGTDVCYLLNRLPSLADHVHQGSEDTGVSPSEQGFPHTFIRNKAI